MEEEMRRSSEVLLAMRIVALTPLMLFIDVWAKTSLVRVYHKFLDIHCFLVLVKVLTESLISHQISYGQAFLSAVWQGINFLFFFI
jgi:hypothetical protein